MSTPAAGQPAEDATPPVDGGEQPERTQAEVDALVEETLGSELPMRTTTAPEVPPTDEGEPTPDEPATPPAEAEPEADPVDPPKPADPEPKPDPKPEDEPEVEEELFIEVEDAEGNKYKIEKESDLPEDFEPKNNRQVIEILRQLSELDQKKVDRANAAAAQAEEQAQIDRQEQVLSRWDSEIEVLEDEGMLDKPKIAPGEPGFEADPANQKVTEVFSFMTEENKKRAGEGKPPLTSFTQAYYLQQAREQKAAEAAAAKADNAKAKRKASLIGGGTAGGAGGGEVYRAGSAKSIDDIEI